MHRVQDGLQEIKFPQVVLNVTTKGRIPIHC